MEQLIALDHIEPNPGNVRRDLGDVTELANSIGQIGVLQPLVVAPTDDPDRWVLIAGHRRRAAAELAGLTQVPCLVREQLAERPAQLVAMLGENLMRADITPVEEAAAYQELLEFPGWDATRIAAQVGRSKQTVRARLKLGKLPEATREQLHAGQMTLEHAEALADFAGTKWEGPLSRAVLDSPSSWEWELARARRERDGERKAAKVRKELEKAGTRVVTGNETWEPLEYLYEDGATGPVDPEAHTSCPGHAVYVTSMGEAVPACTDPEANGHPRPKRTLPPWAASSTAGSPVAGAAEEAAKRQAQREELGANLRIAGDVRAAHLCEVLARPLEKTGGAALLVSAWIGEEIYPLDGDAPLALALMGTPGPADERPEAAAAALQLLASDKPAAALALVVAALEHDLMNPNAVHNWGYQTHREYLTWLQATGYELSEFEEALLEEHAPEPEDDDTDDQADDEGEE